MFDKRQPQLKKKNEVDYLHSYQKFFPFWASLERNVTYLILHPGRWPSLPAATQSALRGWRAWRVRTLVAGLAQPAGQAAAGSQDVVAAGSILALAHLVAVKPKESIRTSWKYKTSFFLAKLTFLFGINSSSEIWEHRALIFSGMLCHTSPCAHT